MFLPFWFASREAVPSLAEAKTKGQSSWDSSASSSINRSRSSSIL